MRRVLLSIAVSFGLIATYAFSVAIIFILTGENTELLTYLDYPLRLPKFLPYYLSPPTAEDFSPLMNQRKILVAIFVYAANVLLYSLPAYLLLTLISRRISRRRKVELTQTEPPPPPPSFAN
ncbi:MAG TPA: hypothetical protein VF656_13290 [Pyrinomonadaceae bacterium]|jgi:hypothetical protein